MTGVPFTSFNHKKTLPFHVPEAWKRIPFRAEPLCLGHHSTQPPPLPQLLFLPWEGGGVGEGGGGGAIMAQDTVVLYDCMV